MRSDLLGVAPRAFAIFTMASIAGTTALAQRFPVESELMFEVWDGTQWASQVSVAPSSRVE
jgi:hypothetical protein